MNGYEKDDIEEAAAGLIRAATRAIPFLMWAAGMGLMLNFILSSPFEVSCKTVEAHKAPRRDTLLEVPMMKPTDEPAAEPTKHEPRE